MFGRSSFKHLCPLLDAQSSIKMSGCILQEVHILRNPGLKNIKISVLLIFACMCCAVYGNTSLDAEEVL